MPDFFEVKYGAGFYDECWESHRIFKSKDVAEEFKKNMEEHLRVHEEECYYVSEVYAGYFQDDASIDESSHIRIGGHFTWLVMD